MELKKIKLKKLLLDLPIKIIGNKDLEITGLSAHSKMVSPGHLFIAKGGLKNHGATFMEEAIHGGAKAILTDLFDPFCKEVTQIICADPGSLEGELAKRFYGAPANDLSVIGITGTNGKTTCAYITRALLGEQECGLIGTIEYILGSNILPASFTTPDAISNHKMLARIKKENLKSCVMEVTSHGIAQNRVSQIPFDIALFTNLSQDHLDYHKSLQNYVDTKSKLFEGLSEDKVALVNNDSPYSKEMIKNCKAQIKTYGVHNKSDYQARNIRLKADKTLFNLIYDQKKYKIETNLVGEFNVYNTLAAISIAIESKVDITLIQERLKNFKAPKGRLQAIENSLGIQIFVDFAHTDDALKNVLTTLKQLKHKKLITVFGCGGDRDQDKRPLMGQAVSSLSDLTIITSDNPRSEDPTAICKAIQEGCSKRKKVFIEVDRKEAIQKALKLAKAKDIILIAGRGHETHQIVRHKRIPFSDADVVKELLSNLKA